MHTWGPSLESLPLAGPGVPKARGWGSLSLCLFPFDNTSVCNLRQVGEEKKKRKGKKKKKTGKIAQLFPPPPPPLSPPRPARSHVTVTQRRIGAAREAQPGALRGTNPNFWPGAGRERPWGWEERKLTLGEK